MEDFGIVAEVRMYKMCFWESKLTVLNTEKNKWIWEISGDKDG